MRAAALVLALSAAGAVAADAPRATVMLEIAGFKPATLTVKRGATVSFVNKDIYPHTATSAGHFDSKEIAPGKTWKYTAKQAGHFDYICTLHPNMKGTLVVE